MSAYRRLIAMDFDGVLHSYTSPWTDAATISDPPTPGAMQFLKSLVEDGRFDVVIVSSRLSCDDGEQAMLVWLRDHTIAELGTEMAETIAERVELSATRPPAFLTIDDRGYQFTGTWPDLDVLAAFKPWNKRPPSDPNLEDGGNLEAAFDACEAVMDGGIHTVEEVVRATLAAYLGQPVRRAA